MLLPLLIITLGAVEMPTTPVFVTEFELTIPQVLYARVEIAGVSQIETDFALPRYDRIQ